MKYARRVVQQLLSESDWEWDTSGRVARRVAWSGSERRSMWCDYPLFDFQDVRTDSIITQI